MFSSVHPWNDTRVYYKEALSIASMGYEIELHAIKNNIVYDKEKTNLKVFCLEKRKRNTRFKTLTELLSRALKSKADIYHFHDPELLPIGYVIKKITKAKVVFDMHEDFPAAIRSKEWIPEHLRIPISKFVGVLEKYFLKKCDAVIFAEKYYKENYEKINIIKQDIYNYPLENLNKMNSLKNEVPEIVYAGAISKSRGFMEMLYLARELKFRGIQFKINIIGEIPLSLRNDTNQFIEDNQLLEVVEFTGRLPLNQVVSYYEKASIGLAILHPEKNYLRSLATKIFEYMSHGIPVIASNFPEWKELIEENNCGIVVDPFDVKQIASAVEQLLKTEKTRMLMGSNGYKAYKNKYNWDLEEKKLSDLYSMLYVERESRK